MQRWLARWITLLIAPLVQVLPCAAGPAVIKGIVLENQSSYPLARSRVRLIRLDGNTLSGVANQLSGPNGQFVFERVPEGYYYIAAVRASYAESWYGQRRPYGSGVPIHIRPDGEFFAEMRLRKLAVITGKVVDENRVGLPKARVVAYSATPPMRLAASGETDDRGVYRITGLAPGKYFVRNAATLLEDGIPLLPTWFPFTTMNAREAREVIADLDQEAQGNDIQPVVGNLSGIGGGVVSCVPGSAVKVTLASDTGRSEQSTTCNGGFMFSGLSPGNYELAIEGTCLRGPCGYHDRLNVSPQPRDLGKLPLEAYPRIAVRLEPAAAGPVPLRLRRRDLAGAGPVREEQIRAGQEISVPHGYWDVAAAPGPSYYVSNIAHGSFRNAHPFPDPDWYSVGFTGGYGRMDITLSAQAARVSGVATLSGAPALGAPVFLLPVSKETRLRMNGVRRTITGANGRYEFVGVAPGDYLLLASWDIADPNEETITASNAKSIRVEEGGSAQHDLAVNPF